MSLETDQTVEAAAVDAPPALPPIREHRNAYARYVKILTRPLGTEQTELDRIVADLRISPEKLASDRAVVARFHELSQVWGGRGVAVNEHRHRENLHTEAKRRHQNELDEHSRAVDHARRRVEECDKAAVQLDELKAQHPQLFDVEGHPARLITAAT